LLVASKAVWFYAGKILLPVNLVFVYPRWELATDAIGSWLPLAGVAAGAVVLWVGRRQPWARAGAFGLGYFVVALLPVLGIVDVYYFRYSFVADHFQYLAGLGLIACAASLLGRLLGPAAGVVLLLLSMLTWRQAHIYHDNGTLWHNTVIKNPGSWMAHVNL